MLKDSEDFLYEILCIRMRFCRLAENLSLLLSHWKATYCQLTFFLACAQPVLLGLQLLCCPFSLSVLNMRQRPKKVILCNCSSDLNQWLGTWTPQNFLLFQHSPYLVQAIQRKQLPDSILTENRLEEGA